MTTVLHKAVKRKTQSTRRDRSKQRKIVITLYPAHGDAEEIIGFRLEGTRTEEIVFVNAVYEFAVRCRVFKERMEKAKKKKLKKERGW